MTLEHQLISEITAQINSQVFPLYRKNITPIQLPSQGDFPWFWNQLGIFNLETFNYISARVSPGNIPGTAKLSSAGGFPNAYHQVLLSIGFKLSSADQERLDAASAGAIGQSVVNAYEKTFGAITAEDLRTAATALGYASLGKIDYVMSYIIAYQWSGRKAENLPPLTYSDLTGARDLTSLLNEMPGTGGTVVDAVANYLLQNESISSLLKRVHAGSWTIAQLQKNTSAPTAQNGGMRTINPANGEIPEAHQVGYSISTPVASIQNELSDKSRIISVRLETSGDSASGLTIRFSGGASASVSSAVEFISDSGSYYNMNTIPGSSTQTTIIIGYEGYSMVPISPTAWQQDTNVGWYYGSPIAQAAKNGNMDVTGFKFMSTPPFKMGSSSEGGNFGLLLNLLISNRPTITITYTSADFNEFRENWNTTERGSLKLLGASTFGGSFSSQLRQGTSDSEFSLTFTPESGNLPVSPLQEKAYVIGGVVDYPPAIFTDFKSGSITVKNSGGFVATFSVQYQQSGNKKTAESGDFTYGVTKNVQLPSNATDILVTIKIAVFIKTWSVIGTYKYDSPVTKLFEVSGTTLDAEIKEIE